MKPPVAILCSDLHLCERLPSARGESQEAWFGVIGGYLDQINDIADGVPVVCAGDVFDRWDSSANLINFVISKMPHMWAVSGQHDAPHHRYEDIRKSAYWTLVEAGKITNLEPGKPCAISKGLVAWGFPWGFPLRPLEKRVPKSATHLAVAHRYLWDDRAGGHPGATADTHARATAALLKGFDVALLGDNHNPFANTVHGVFLYNHGLTIRRRRDERDYVPEVGLLYADATIERVPLDTSGDLWADEPAPDAAPSVDARELVSLLRESADAIESFSDTLRHAAAAPDVPPGVREHLLKWSGDAQS